MPFNSMNVRSATLRFGEIASHHISDIQNYNFYSVLLLLSWAEFQRNLKNKEKLKVQPIGFEP